MQIYIVRPKQKDNDNDKDEKKTETKKTYWNTMLC